MKVMSPPSRTPPEGPVTAEQAFNFWLSTPHHLDDEYDAPASRGDVFLRFMNMIDAAGWAFVPKEPTRDMTMHACDFLPSCEHVFGHAGKLCADVYRQMLEAARSAALTSQHQVEK